MCYYSSSKVYATILKGRKISTTIDCAFGTYVLNVAIAVGGEVVVSYARFEIVVPEERIGTVAVFVSEFVFTASE